MTASEPESTPQAQNAIQPTLARRSTLWRIMRTLPLIVLLLSMAALAIMFLMGGMTKISAWYLMQSYPPILGLLVVVACGIYALIKRRASRLWRFTMLAALVMVLPLLLLIKPMPFPASLEKTTPAATVRLPANVPLLVAWGGDRIDTNYHVPAADQRWAYDLVVEPYFTGSSKVEDYGCYGVDVVAPASGLVTEAHDGEPDAVPGVVSNNYTAPKGNYVTIQLESGTYLVIAHLKPGSVAVNPGTLVTEGQVIAQCGNSGNTSEPHIHIHHQRQDPALFPLNFAEGLPLYFRDHDGPPMPVGGFKVVDGTPVPTGDVVQHIGK